jgi:CRP/FNR family transcriptional regulator
MRRDIHNSDIPVLCRSCELRHRGVCGTLSPEQLITLGRQTTQKEIPAGTELIASGEPVTNYATILSGVVKLSKLLSDGRRQIVGLQFAPDFLGRPFRESGQVTAEAATVVRLCSFPKRVLDRMLEQSPELEHLLLEQALQELDEARDWMVTLGRKTAEERVASFLLLIATYLDPEAEQDETDPVSFDLPMTRNDIGDFLGLTIETTSRQLTRLRHAGIIDIEHNRTITIPDLERLRRHSGE